MNADIERILLSEEKIKSTVKAIADRINKDLMGEELIVIVVLKGSLVFASDLIRELNMPVKLEFMRVSSYGAGTESSGELKIKLDLDTSIEGKNVLIAEDIIDSGNTLARLKKLLISRNPKTCRICAFLDKPERRTAEVEAEYTGEKIPNEFVVGYGLDYNEQYRNLPYVGILKREVYETN